MPVGHSAIPYVSYQQKVFQPKPRVRSFNLSREKCQANAIAAESKRTRLWHDLKEHCEMDEGSCSSCGKVWKYPAKGCTTQCVASCEKP
ncbi:hypothetical protein K439DRAFT_334962 [Ramaria rubella]|nr:hypothetical protein K439DRAFT_334962 [Ramaria rubella]